MEITENELVECFEIKNFKQEIKQCKYENSKRLEIQELIDSISVKHAVGRKNIFISMDNIFAEYLPHRE